MKKIILIFTLLLILVGCEQTNTTNMNLNENKTIDSDTIYSESKLPFKEFDFVSEDLEGNEINSKDIYKNSKLTLVNLWAVTCPPCLAEMPELENISNLYEKKDLQVIGIIGDVANFKDEQSKEAIKNAKAIISETGVNYLNVLNNEDLYDNYFKNIVGTPTSFFVDSEGKLLGPTLVGAKEEEEFKSTIDSILEKIQ